jgi:membrane protease YdiL (CAAX protease family)
MSESLQTAPSKPWGIIATALWALGSLAVFIGMVLLFGVDLGRGEISGLLVGTFVGVQLLALPAEQRGWRASEYLGWIVPNPRDAAVTLAAFVALILAIDALYYLLNLDVVPPVQINTYRSAREAGVELLVMLWIAVIVLSPLGEEILFRGFLYRGWVRSPRAVVPAVLVISALWAILHRQYDWLWILQIFLHGLVLGWARWRSGSTMLTFAMHAFNNAWSTVETHWLA